MEFYRETSYKVPRTTVFTLLNAEAIAQRFGWLEIVDFTVEWIKAERLRHVVEEHFPQDADDSYVVTLSPPERLFEGHNLFNLSGQATRFTKDGPTIPDLSGRSKLLIGGIS